MRNILHSCYCTGGTKFMTVMCKIQGKILIQFIIFIYLVTLCRIEILKISYLTSRSTKAEFSYVLKIMKINIFTYLHCI